MGAWIGLMKKRMIRRWARPGAFLRPASASVSGPFPLPLERAPRRGFTGPSDTRTRSALAGGTPFNALDNNQSTRSGFDDSFTSQNDLTDSSRIDYSPAADPADLRLPASTAAPPVLSHHPKRFGIAIPANAFH
ncbi:hypothetical protein [Burkholderia sp. 567]|uniref:hypothetical protein n=1 Tax=Burkholderia sp. 567 TaxID=3156413 RepID=UPI003393905A